MMNRIGLYDDRLDTVDFSSTIHIPFMPEYAALFWEPGFLSASINLIGPHWFLQHDEHEFFVVSIDHISYLVFYPNSMEYFRGIVKQYDLEIINGNYPFGFKYLLTEK